jgi:hypothetical protein
MKVRVVFRLDGEEKITKPFSLEGVTLLSNIISLIAERGGVVTEVRPEPEPVKHREWPRYTRADGRPLIYLPSWFPFDFVGRDR